MPVGSRPAQEFGVAGYGVRLPGVAGGRLRGRPVGLVRVQGREDLGAGHPVDRRVVDAQERGERAGRDVLEVVEPIDEVELPRWAAQVEGSSMDPGDLGAELTPGAGLRQREVPHVVLEVEPLVPDPPRPVESERYVDHPLTEALGDVEALLDEGEHLVVGHGPGGAGRPVVDADDADRVVRRGAIEGHHHPVGTRHLSHGSPSVAPVAPPAIRMRTVPGQEAGRAGVTSASCTSPAVVRIPARWSRYAADCHVVR